MKLTKIIAYIASQLLRLWVTAMTAIVVYCPLSELAYAERGYWGFGGEWILIALCGAIGWRL